LLLFESRFVGFLCRRNVLFVSDLGNDLRRVSAIDRFMMGGAISGCDALHGVVDIIILTI
jgi:hypothetical protein